MTARSLDDLVRLSECRSRSAQAKVARARDVQAQAQKRVTAEEARLKTLRETAAKRRKTAIADLLESPATIIGLARMVAAHRVVEHEIFRQGAAVREAEAASARARTRVKSEQAAMAQCLRHEKKMAEAARRIAREECVETRFEDDPDFGSS